MVLVAMEKKKTIPNSIDTFTDEIDSSTVESEDILSVRLVDNANDNFFVENNFNQQCNTDANNVDILHEEDLFVDSTIETEKPLSQDLLVPDELIIRDKLVHPVLCDNENDEPGYIDENVEGEINMLMLNSVECENVPFENSESECYPNERSHSVISQLSIDCVQEDIVCEDFSPVNYRVSAGKRIRSQSSCGDSAIVEDYSSDALSISGSDSAVKSSEGEVCSSDCKPSAEEQGIKSAFYPNENIRNYRDWYGPSIGSSDFKERTEKTRHWGSVPVSDTDSDNECIFKRTAKIGSVSLDKLSIELNEELSKIKSLDERRDTTKYSSRHQKQGRRRNRKSETKNVKKQSTSKQLPQPKKGDSSRRSKKKSSCSSPKKDIDKPWRNQDTGKRCDIIGGDTKRVTIEYEFPDDMCGRLIGKSGRHISEFKESNGVDICIECELHGKNRIVSMTGVLTQVKKAEKILNEKFKDSLKLIDFPDIMDAEGNISNISLPENTEFNVVVTAIIDVGNFYVQLYNREVEERLTQLQTELHGCYITPRQKYIYMDKDIPNVDEYCVSFVDNVWCRLKILEVYPEMRMVDAFFIDYGGNVNLSLDTIWRIRPDLLQIPAQAILCHLSSAIPLVGNTEFSYEANDLFYQLVGAKALQAFVTSIKDEIPSVQLTYFNEDRGEMFSVLEQMQLWGLVQDETIPLCEEFPVRSISPQGNYPLDDCIMKNLIPSPDANTQLVESILNCSAPQFICAS